jgi:hypothetical protein
MWDYQALTVIHILLFVFWLGTDVGVFYMGMLIQQQSLSLETRGTLAKVMHVLDQFPRTCLILMIPVAIGLVRIGGWGFADVPVGVLWLIAAIAVVWAAASVWAIGFHAVPRAAHAFMLGDRVLRVAFVGAAVVVLSLSSSGSGPLPQTWLIVKLALFTTIVLAGALIDFLPNPFENLGLILTSGSTPEREAGLRRGLAFVYPVVVYIYLALITMSIFAVIKIV